MEKSYPKNYGMGVIVGFDEMRISLLVNQLNTENCPVYIANLNTYDQITLQGIYQLLKRYLP